MGINISLLKWTFPLVPFARSPNVYPKVGQVKHDHGVDLVSVDVEVALVRVRVGISRVELRTEFQCNVDGS